MFLEVCDPLLLNRQRSLKHLLTEPEQQDREGSVILNALIEVQQFLDDVIKQQSASLVRLGNMEIQYLVFISELHVYCLKILFILHLID